MIHIVPKKVDFDNLSEQLTNELIAEFNKLYAWNNYRIHEDKMFQILNSEYFQFEGYQDLNTNEVFYAVYTTESTKPYNLFYKNRIQVIQSDDKIEGFKAILTNEYNDILDRFVESFYIFNPWDLQYNNLKKIYRNKEYDIAELKIILEEDYLSLHPENATINEYVTEEKMKSYAYYKEYGMFYLVRLIQLTNNFSKKI